MGKFANLTSVHIPVLLHEVLDGLAIHTGGRYVDATVGGAGHAQAILEASAPTGQLLGLDRDPEAVTRAKGRLVPFGARARVVHASYARLKEIVRAAGFYPVDGLLFDLGFSSWQVGDPNRGFAFRRDGPLDMRYDPTDENAPTAAQLVNTLTEEELTMLLRRYGEEPYARRIARAIVSARPLHSTGQLARVVAGCVGRQHRRIHPATRTFQALRIAVNRELELLEAALPQAVTLLRPGGRLAVITFHSLEDRIVKKFFKQEARGCICPPDAPICTCGRMPTLRIITRKPITPSTAEREANPRSRSAKLRIAERC